MTDQSGVTATAPKKRGPKSKAEIEAEIRAELTAKVEAEVREKIEAEIREKAQAERAAQQVASDTRPINASQISGDPTAQGAVTIHFVDDGFTILGKLWYRGEELTVVPGTPEWELSQIEIPPKGSGQFKCFALFDEYEQEEKWGRRLFREGPWRGKRLDEIDDENLTDAEREQLRRAEQQRMARMGGVLPRR